MFHPSWGPWPTVGLPIRAPETGAPCAGGTYGPASGTGTGPVRPATAMRAAKSAAAVGVPGGHLTYSVAVDSTGPGATLQSAIGGPYCEGSCKVVDGLSDLMQRRAESEEAVNLANNLNIFDD